MTGLTLEATALSWWSADGTRRRPLSVPARVRELLARPCDPWKANPPASELGPLLGSALPPDFSELLEQARFRLWLRADDALPWEGALWRGKPLARQCQLRRVERPPAEPRRLSLPPPYRVLQVADCEGLHPWARREELGEPGRVEVTRLIGARAGLRPLAQALQSDSYTILHLTVGLSASEMALADGPVSPRRLADSLGGLVPPLVVLHPLCLGREVGGSLERLLPWLSLLGERALVTFRRDVPGGACLPFYRALAAGQGSEAALQHARVSPEPDDPFLHFGDTDLELPGLSGQPMETLDSRLRPGYRLRFLAGPEEGRQVVLYAQALTPGRVLTLGRRGLGGNDVEIDDPELEERVASLEVAPDGLILVNLSGRGEVRVNGLAVSARCPLFGGEQIELGQNRLELVLGGPSVAVARRSEPPRASLLVRQGVPEDQGRSFPLQAALSLIGRFEQCAVPLHDPTVSRQHVSLQEREGAYFLQPVGERTVIVNGLLADRERELRPGDRIQIGETILELRWTS